MGHLRSGVCVCVCVLDFVGVEKGYAFPFCQPGGLSGLVCVCQQQHVLACVGAVLCLRRAVLGWRASPYRKAKPNTAVLGNSQLTCFCIRCVLLSGLVCMC